MENTEKRPVSAEEPQKKEHKFTLTPSESAFFRQLEKSLKYYAADMTAPNPLEVLHDNFRRLNRLFISFERPWLADCGILQKACGWYLAYAKPSKEEARHLLDTLGGFTASACQLSECCKLIIRMQTFFHTQEKELRRLFDYERQTARKRKEHGERLESGGTGYCLTIGKGEIYGVTYPQIEDLYRVMGRFIEREKAPFQCKIKASEGYNVCVSKHVSLYADRDEFNVNYSLDNIDADFDWMPAGQLQQIADAASAFLRVFGENGERQVRWDAADYPIGSQPGIAFSIREDSRLPTFRTVPWISKRISQEGGKETEIEYYIDVNETHSQELTFGEFVAVYRKLGEFLNRSPEAVR